MSWRSIALYGVGLVVAVGVVEALLKKK